MYLWMYYPNIRIDKLEFIIIIYSTFIYRFFRYWLGEYYFQFSSVVGDVLIIQHCASFVTAYFGYNSRRNDSLNHINVVVNADNQSKYLEYYNQSPPVYCQYSDRFSFLSLSHTHTHSLSLTHSNSNKIDPHFFANDFIHTMWGENIYLLDFGLQVILVHINTIS